MLAEAFEPVNGAPFVHSNIDSTLRASSSDVHQYTDDELKQTAPEPAHHLHSKIANYLISIVNDVGQANSAAQKFESLRLSEPKNEDYFLSHATGYERTQGPVERKKLQDTFQEESRKAALTRFTNNLEWWQELKEGMDFELNFASLFAKESPAPSQANAVRTDPVRYGLVLEEIIPATERGHLSASLAMTPEEELQSAAKAKPKWGIGPISHNEPSKPFSSYQETSSDHHRHTQELQAPVSAPTKQQKTSFWQTGPSPVIDGNIRPANLPTPEDKEPSAAKPEKGFPPLGVSIGQKEGLYVMKYNTTPTLSRDHKTTRHQFRVPVYGKLAVAKTYDHKMRPDKTSFLNIFTFKNTPELSVHYLHQKEQYITECHYTPSSYLRMSVSARSKAKREDGDKDEEAYQIDFTKDF